MVKSRIYIHQLDNIAQLQAKAEVNTLKIEANEMDRLWEVRDFKESKQQQFQKRFDRSDECYISEVEGKAVHYSWVRTRDNMYIGDARRKINFTEDQFWIFDCRTHESARGLGIYPLTLTRILSLKKEEGKQEGFIDVANDNIPSIKGIEKTGFRLHKTLTTQRIFGNFYLKY